MARRIRTLSQKDFLETAVTFVSDKRIHFFISLPSLDSSPDARQHEVRRTVTNGHLLTAMEYYFTGYDPVTRFVTILVEADAVEFVRTALCAAACEGFEIEGLPDAAYERGRRNIDEVHFLEQAARNIPTRQRVWDSTPRH